MKKNVYFLCFALCICLVLISGCTVPATQVTPAPTQVPTTATHAISCDTNIIEPGGMYSCSTECPSGNVQNSTIWINGQAGKFVSADSHDSPGTLTCYSEGPARCGATCV